MKEITFTMNERDAMFLISKNVNRPSKYRIIFMIIFFDK